MKYLLIIVLLSLGATAEAQKFEELIDYESLNHTVELTHMRANSRKNLL